MKLTKIYTRTGDKGKTSLVGGQRINKDSVRLEAYGTMDELSSQLGLLASLLGTNEANKAIAQEIERIQCNIFNVCTFLATNTDETPIYPSAKLAQQEIDHIEALIDDANATLPPLSSFILPGGCTQAAQCHVCRTVCRRAERRIVTLYSEAYPTETDTTSEAYQQAQIMLGYVNRLSDYFFVLSRKLNIINNTEEKTWQNTCR